MKNDRNAQSDIYTELKKEDKKFGEKTGKNSAKDQPKRPKHSGQQDFRKMRVSDILAMSDDTEEEFEVA